MSDRKKSRETIIEAAVTAHRDRDRSGRVQPSPAWHDLSAEDREELFEQQLISRTLEQALDANGLTSTAREVLGRVWGIGQAERR